MQYDGDHLGISSRKQSFNLPDSACFQDNVLVDFITFINISKHTQVAKVLTHTVT